MRVAFHNPNVSIRGTFAAMVDYAEMTRSRLGHDSRLFLNRALALAHQAELPVLTQGLPISLYDTREELGQGVRDFGADFFYEICPGTFHSLPRVSCPVGIHVVFPHGEFFGDRLRYISPWLSRVMTRQPDRFVPFWVRRYESRSTLRTDLGIPEDARVFGRHGGWDTFNIPFVHRVVRAHARRHPEDHFVFLNTQPITGTEGEKNIHYLPPTVEPEAKARFLATCDAMLHARWHGETFGAAVAEFAVLGKPVLTYANSRERAHLELLGAGGRKYRNEQELEHWLRTFERGGRVETGFEPYTDPERVILMFAKQFLENPS